MGLMRRSTVFFTLSLLFCVFVLPGFAEQRRTIKPDLFGSRGLLEAIDTSKGWAVIEGLKWNMAKGIMLSKFDTDFERKTKKGITFHKGIYVQYYFLSHTSPSLSRYLKNNLEKATMVEEGEVIKRVHEGGGLIIAITLLPM